MRDDLVQAIRTGESGVVVVGGKEERSDFLHEFQRRNLKQLPRSFAASSPLGEEQKSEKKEWTILTKKISMTASIMVVLDVARRLQKIGVRSAIALLKNIWAGKYHKF